MTVISSRRLDPQEYIQRANEVHEGFYSYEKTQFVTTTDKIVVTCPEHGDFLIAPHNHLYNKHGCPQCGALKRGRRKDPLAAGRATADTKIAKFAAKFESEARAVHGDKYDYSQVVYEGMKVPVTIVCPEHGPFQQTPERHLRRGHGCPACAGRKAR